MTSAPARLFGTDGIRGVAGQYPLDPPTVARIGAAIVRAHHHARPSRLIIGRDTRESGEWIERELARGATSQGAAVVSGGVLPTPAVAYLAGAQDFDLGVVISASHNPFHDNGIKVFSGKGEKFGEIEERAVEAILADASVTVKPSAEAHLQTGDYVEAYLDHVRRLLPDAGPLAGARIAVDMGNGATTTTAVRTFEAIGFEVVPLGQSPNGRNINLGCGSTHPAHAAAAVTSMGCRLGVSFDGDGDRAIFVDHRGHVVDGDAVLLTLGHWLKQQGRLTGDTVVATVMSNIGLEIAFRERGIRMVRTPVGDKYVMEEMRRHGYVLGGEQSGHVILAEHLFTGDGLATALAVLRVMIQTGASLADLAGALVTFPQTLVNVRVREKRSVADVPEIAAAVARVEAAQAGRGRTLVRYSGTEPLLRVMIEGEDQASVNAWAEEIAEAVRSTTFLTMAVALSVNVNKVATLRNSRGGAVPSVVAAVRTCLGAGAPGITVHPRQDARHIRPDDVTAIAAELRAWRATGRRVEFNIEGDPRPDLIAMVLDVRPDQCTLVPVKRGEITSQAGWPADTPRAELADVVARLKTAGIRVSLFVDPEPAPVAWAASLGGDRVELYTEPFARAFAESRAAGEASFARYAAAAERAHALGLGVNAGHDLDLDNLELFRRLPHLDEVSIGHALISHALWVGLEPAVRDYLTALNAI